MDQPRCQMETMIQEPQEETVQQKSEEIQQRTEEEEIHPNLETDAVQQKQRWEEQQKIHQKHWEEQQKIAEKRREFQRELAEERIRFREELTADRRRFMQELTADRRRFEQEQQEFYLKKEREERRLAEKERLIKAKWELLEMELQKLAGEREAFEKKKEAEAVKSNGRQARMTVKYPSEMELFFSGVENALDMKKRYRELIKIFHPDNSTGDTQTLQMINRTYESLKKQFSA
ncbi:MAG: hypothetical protein HFI70_03185 [Lachnospiraceae bacterium]|nr:hypothetical protein [Lachnospiraceae bacterium]